MVVIMWIRFVVFSGWPATKKGQSGDESPQSKAFWSAAIHHRFVFFPPASRNGTLNG
jgi:hypothetical protein